MFDLFDFPRKKVDTEYGFELKKGNNLILFRGEINGTKLSGFPDQDIFDLAKNMMSDGIVIMTDNKNLAFNYAGCNMDNLYVMAVAIKKPLIIDGDGCDFDKIPLYKILNTPDDGKTDSTDNIAHAVFRKLHSIDAVIFRNVRDANGGITANQIYTLEQSVISKIPIKNAEGKILTGTLFADWISKPK